MEEDKNHLLIKTSDEDEIELSMFGVQRKIMLISIIEKYKEEKIENKLEELYWEFDAKRNGYSKWKGRPLTERDAYKTTLRSFYNFLETIK